MKAEYNNKEKEGAKLKAYAFIIGMIIAAIGIIAGLFTGDFSKTYWLSGIAAAIGIVFSGITMGAFVGGMETRANYFSETKEHHQSRFSLTMLFSCSDCRM
ncbi:DUF5316 domain-containing protein [Heyndrickxia faecalis]|uniref:DUF5316 domain-containing protein n=1 Tax=Heyndrickxia faecalis TaxID=2824910 RepID=UPI0007967871|nr:hypothetical protein B4100_0504 [Heyndrickxia coagulans]